MMCLIALLFTHGFRPGSVIENRHYTGHGQVLNWDDTEWIVKSWQPGVGLVIQVFLAMRDNDGLV